MDLLSLCTEEDGELLDEIEGEATGRKQARRSEQNIVLEIHAGSGGREAQDFAGMLVRMYLKFARRRGIKHEILELATTQDSGVRTALIRMTDAPVAILKESGVHRLARVSPIGSGSGKRQTSFCAVNCLEIEEEGPDRFQIPDQEIRYETLRSSGPGGQHANVTASAVRAIHIPTGLRTKCQNERSQHRNRGLAKQILEAKVKSWKEGEKRLDARREHKNKAPAGFGQQVRSYLLDEGTIRDHLHGTTTRRAQRVLNGRIEEMWIGKK